jgi:ABC-type multidrug transport system ATPase subunit
VGGKEINPIQFRKNIAYVMQDDSLLPTTTPREALRFSASLRLPSTVSSMEINDRVEKLLEELGLLVCADVCIGNEVIKGVSGGQRKRTSVGIEIITEPTVST